MTKTAAGIGERDLGTRLKEAMPTMRFMAPPPIRLSCHTRHVGYGRDRRLPSAGSRFGDFRTSAEQG